MKKTMWVALVLALLLTGCGSKDVKNEYNLFNHT